MPSFYVYAYLRSKDSKNGLAGSPYYCGTFAPCDEAAQAYNLKAVELYGDQAILNNIELRKAA